MAAKKQNIVLQLDLDLPRGKIKEFDELLNESTKIKMDSGKGKDLFAAMNTSIKSTTIEATKLLKLFNKPIKNAEAAKQLGNSFSQVFKDLNNKMLSFQGNVAKIFNSKENQEALQTYKELGETIENLKTNLGKVSNLNSKRSAIGNTGSINKEISAAKKEQKTLEKTKDKWTETEVKRYEELNQIIEEGNKKLKEKEKINKRINNIHAKSGASNQGDLERKIQELSVQRNNLGNGMLSPADVEVLNTLLNTYRNDLRMLDAELDGLGDRGEESWNQINSSQERTEKKIRTFRQVLQGLGLGFSIQELARGLKQLAKYSFDFYRGLDKALTNISIVTRKSREEVQAYTKEFISMAKQTGMSIDDIAQGAVIFFQQGLTDEEALKMTQVAAEFAKVADITVESASDKLTAAVNGYNMAVSEAADVADKLNVLAAESAASIDELATAMEKGASMASQAGLSFDKYNAILATMIEVTREAPENIGTSMKTIMARFQQIKEAGTTEDGDTDVNAVETALKSVGVSLRDEEGVLRDLGDVLDDLGPKWESLDRNTQAYLGTVIAGTRQQSRFISLMQNWDRALELTEASEQSAGAQALQHQLAMDGLEASINSLTIAWQNFLAKLTTSDTFKTVLDFLSGTLNVINKLNIKGLVLTGIIATLGVKMAKAFAATRKEIALNGSDKTKQGFFFRMNEGLAQMWAQADENKKKMQEMGQTAQESGLTVGTVFKNSVIEGTSFGSVLQRLITLWNSNTASATGFFAKAGAGFKALAVKAGQSIKSFVKNNPMVAATLIISAFSAIGSAIDSAIFDGDKKLEEANQKLTETLDKLEIASGKLSTISSNLETYKELSNAISLSVEEQEKLNKATENLAENVKEAVIGYDAMGNAILDINKIEAAEAQAKKDKEDASREVFGDIGSSIAADLESRGESNAKDKWYQFDAGTSAATLGSIGAIIGTAIAPGVGTLVGAAIGGLAGLVTGWVSSYNTAKAEEDKLARKEYAKLLRSHQEELLEAMDTITDAYVTYGEDITDEHGRTLATAEDKQNVAARMQSEFLNSKTAEIGEKVTSGELDADEAAAELEKLGDQWEDTLIAIGDSGVNTITAQAMALQKAVDTENKSWNEIKDDMQTTLDNLDIPEESRAAIEEAFKASVYSGTSKGVYQAMQDLERQQKNDKSDAAWKEYYDSEYNWLEKLFTIEKNQRKKWEEKIDAEYDPYWDMINNMGSDQLSAYGRMGITANRDVMKLYDDKYASNLNSTLPIGSENDITMAGLSGLYSMQDEIEAKLLSITDTTSEEYAKWKQMAADTEAAIAETWNQLPLAVEPTWEQLFKQYEEFTERVEKVWSTLEEIKDDGGIDYDQFKDLATLFDDIDVELFSTDQLDKYGNALQTIADNLVLVNGELQLNEQALTSVGDLEEILAQAEIDGVKTKLLAKQAEMEAQKSMVEADLAYMKTQLEVAKSVVDGTYSQEEANAKLDIAKQQFVYNASQLLETYSNNEFLAAQSYAKNWTTAFDTVADEYNKLLYARMTGTTADTKVVTSLQNEGLKLKPTTEGLYKFETMGSAEAQKAVDELTRSIAAAEHTIEAYDLSIKNINLKLALLNSGVKSSKEGYQGASEALDEYISKLERFLDLLRHIEREEMNLKVAEKLEDMQQGVAVIERMYDQLRYVGHLIGDTKEMYNNYEKEANDSAADILKGFGDIVKFHEWGNYEVDMSLYNKLSDEKKELLDESLDAYQELIDERDSYYESYLDYLQQQQEINQKFIDKYIDAEDELVEAIKQREQKILDNKLAAIDKEIEAINKAAEARRKAREDEQNAQELSSMQVDLQRALMDSSGASATQILEIQKQIKEKQQEMADTSFDTMVEDMQTQLEEEKEMEQKLFDERLDEMDWYWAEVDRIMGEGTDSVLETMQNYIDAFNEGSELQQAELLKGWKNTFEQAAKIGKEGALEYQKVVASLQASINGETVDEDILTSSTINTKFVKRPETEEDRKAAEAAAAAAKKRKTSTTTTTTTKQNNNNNNTQNPPAPTKYIITFDDGQGVKVDHEVKAGSAVSLPKKTRSGYTFGGWSVPSQHKTMMGGTSYVPTCSETIVAQWVKKKSSTTTSSPKFVGLGLYTPSGNVAFAKGGMADFTGPAWLDGTKKHPEAVLNAMQTKAFLSFTDDLAALRAEGGVSTNSSVVIDNISFNVESMSSVADGEKAFNTFVDKFKEIGAKQGISILGTANRN